MSIYDDYKKRGLKNYKLRTVEDVKELHDIDILKMKGLENLSENDRQLAIKLFIRYLNGFGCTNRQFTPRSIEKQKNKFKVSFSDGTHSYLYTDATVG